MNFYKKTALIGLIFSMVSQSIASEDNKYWQEFKQLRENPSHKLLFDREASPDLQDILRDLENAKKVGYWGRFARPLIDMYGVVISAETMPALYAYVESLSKAQGMSVPVVMVSQYKGIFNAIAQKIFINSGCIYIGQDLLKESTSAEIEAVIAHELGHIKHDHINKSLALNMASLASYLTLMQKGYINFPYEYKYLAMWLHVITCNYFQWFVDAAVIGKTHERQADAFAASAGHAQGLIAFFERLERKIEKQDTDFDELHAALENAQDKVEKSDLNSLWHRYYVAKMWHRYSKARLWFYHNTPFGPHPSNEDRIAAAKEFLATQNVLKRSPEQASLEIASAA